MSEKHPEYLLRDCSSLFDRLCGERAGETPTDEPIELKDTEPDLFRRMLLWVYRGELTPPIYPFPGDGEFLVDLWALAERLEIPNLQNRAFQALKAEIENRSPRSVTSEMIRHVYHKTGKGSSLRIYTVGAWRLYTPRRQLRRDQDILPREFIEDIYEAILEGSVFSFRMTWERV
ncbi:hypothetical protein P170DRAFT_428975 [Aspergillus steynii IBT 23096]|uniref:BTB domain-containing protein n=1 Tax=Aspergillus steynii IBT 23096 TaxID=1392250 RepID=A0A2I2FYT5_9EURO|nr:uncharacterized protein P170DRAFT_428975 [Aspergillus steynii IBT 23096]PLB45788.1 hypothetical protein P170DRAFT_428975 [Aspergillus steynii IBT 23096]